MSAEKKGNPGILIAYNLTQALKQLGIDPPKGYVNLSGKEILGLNKNMLTKGLQQITTEWLDHVTEDGRFQKLQALLQELGLVTLEQLYLRGEIKIGDGIIYVDNPGGGRGSTVPWRKKDPMVDYRFAVLEQDPEMKNALFMSTVVGICSFDLQTGKWNAPESQMPERKYVVGIDRVIPQTLLSL